MTDDLKQYCCVLKPVENGLGYGRLLLGLLVGFIACSAACFIAGCGSGSPSVLSGNDTQGASNNTTQDAFDNTTQDTSDNTTQDTAGGGMEDAAASGGDNAGLPPAAGQRPALESVRLALVSVGQVGGSSAAQVAALLGGHPDVKSHRIRGMGGPSVAIAVDLNRLAHYNILRPQSVLTAMNGATSVQQLGDSVVQSGPSGILKIKDIAKVSVVELPPEELVYLNGRPAVVFDVTLAKKVDSVFWFRILSKLVMLRRGEMLQLLDPSWDRCGAALNLLVDDPHPHLRVTRLLDELRLGERGHLVTVTPSDNPFDKSAAVEVVLNLATAKGAAGKFLSLLAGGKSTRCALSRKRDAFEVLYKALTVHPDMRLLNASGFGPEISVRLSGAQLKDVQAAVDFLEPRFGDTAGVITVFDNQPPARPTIVLTPDRESMAVRKVEENDLQAVFNAHLYGLTRSIHLPEISSKDIPLTLRWGVWAEKNVTDLTNLLIPNKDNVAFPLRDIAKLELQKTNQSSPISGMDKSQHTITVTAMLAAGSEASAKTQIKQTVRELKTHYENVSVEIVE